MLQIIRDWPEQCAWPSTSETWGQNVSLLISHNTIYICTTYSFGWFISSDSTCRQLFSVHRHRPAACERSALGKVKYGYQRKPSSEHVQLDTRSSSIHAPSEFVYIYIYIHTHTYVHACYPLVLSWSPPLNIKLWQELGLRDSSSRNERGLITHNSI